MRDEQILYLLHAIKGKLRSTAPNRHFIVYSGLYVNSYMLKNKGDGVICLKTRQPGQLISHMLCMFHIFDNYNSF